jgi:hypothetical protein
MPVLAVLLAFIGGSCFVNRQAHARDFDRAHACWIVDNYYDADHPAPRVLVAQCRVNRIARGELPIPVPPRQKPEGRKSVDVSENNP